jgi:hypothetical protein
VQEQEPERRRSPDVVRKYTTAATLVPSAEEALEIAPQPRDPAEVCCVHVTPPSDEV